MLLPELLTKTTVTDSQEYITLMLNNKKCKQPWWIEMDFMKDIQVLIRIEKWLS